MSVGPVETTEKRPAVREHYVAALESPFVRAPEEVRTVFLVTAGAASLPLAAGVVLFGWRAAIVAAISVVSCAVIERLYYWVTRSPALLGRSHAYLTGLLLALTLPASAPWYVPVVAAAFAIVVGKAVFGGVGHFLWQPALVGRLAAAVLFASSMNPDLWPVLGQDKLFWGDLREASAVADSGQWTGRGAPPGADAVLLRHPRSTLAGLTRTTEPRFSALAYTPDGDAVPGARTTAFRAMPPMSDLLIGARGGGIGETSVVIIVVAGLYLIYRNYVKWQLPVSILASAALVAAVAPVRFSGANDTVVRLWWPVLAEEGEVGFIYICYQLVSGGLVLAAFFLATEMTSRPVTTGGQVLFGIGCGALAMYLQLYVATPIPAYVAVLAMNTFTPGIEAIWRPRVLGRARFRRPGRTFPR
ncbi:MAG TPA: RnfABCDGE type electron transport complex subunit D [Phycisphaerae bacterium]|nr:RnfABCDGE type electron transport complex subunit D [Phycisphaerae bacterium]